MADSVNKRFSSAPVVIELCLPNQIMARINVDEQQVGSFLKELIDAATIIR